MARFMIVAVLVGLCGAPIVAPACDAGDPSFVHQDKRDTTGLKVAKAQFAEQRTAIARDAGAKRESVATVIAHRQDIPEAAAILRSVLAK
jgi:hypothetical protein